MELNEPTINNFIREHIKFEGFCDHYRRELATREGATFPELEYENIPGRAPLEKASELVTSEFKIDRKAKLAFYLVDFWLHESNPSHTLTHEKVKMDEQLCAAARDLCEFDQELAQQAFDYLADLNEAFKKEWDYARAHLDLAAAIWDDGEIADLTQHLELCNDRYAHALDLREQRLWAAYQTELLELGRLQPGYARAEVEHITNVDDSTIEALERLYEAARTETFYDHRLPWQIGYPYQGVAELGIPISAHAPMTDIQDALQQLSQADLSDEQQADLEVVQTMLRNEETRLFADVFLYPEHPTIETAGKIEEQVVETGQLPSTDSIIADYADEAAILLVVLGRTKEASDEYKRKQNNNLLNSKAAHCQALLLLAEAYDQQSTASWQDSISQWAITLADSAYWVDWGHHRFDRYGTQLVFGSVGNLKDEHVNNKLLPALEWIEESDEEIRRLSLAMQVEFEAVQLSRALGGIPIRPGRKAWFGPRGMRYFGLEDIVGEYLAKPAPRVGARSRALGDTTPEEALRQLRWYFSYLAIPAVLLTQSYSYPQDVLQALENDDYTGLGDVPDCGQQFDCPMHGDQRFPVLICCPYWDAFDQHNPAYRGFDDPVALMAEDAIQLAVSAYLDLSHAYIQPDGIRDRDALEFAWHSALELAQYSQDREQIYTRFHTMLLAITLQPTSKRVSSDWLTSRINMLDISRDLMSTMPEFDRPLKARLVEYLESRALDRHRGHDLDGAAADFTRALNITPQDHVLRRKLISIYFQEAIDACNRDPFLALDFLNDATNQIDEAASYPDYDYAAEKRWIEESRNNVLDGRPLIFIKSLEPHEPVTGEFQISGVSQAYGNAIRETRQGNYERALDILDEALRHNPQHGDLQDAAADALLFFAWLKARDEEHAEGLERLYDWKPRLPQIKQFPAQVNFYKHWPQLALCLTYFPDQWSLIHQDRQLRFPQVDDNMYYTPEVTAYIEDDQYLCFNAPLRPFATNKLVQGLKNMLVASSNIVLFKLCSIESDELVLRSHIPLDMLNADRVGLSYFKANNFLDVASETMLNLDDLQARYREIRANFSSDFRHMLPPPTAVRIVERLCQQNHWPGNRLTDVQYKINIPDDEAQIRVDDHRDGVSLSMELGRLREGLTQAALLNLTRLNATRYDSKLTLTADLIVVLSIELPELDESKAQSAIDKLRAQARDLRLELTS